MTKISVVLMIAVLWAPNVVAQTAEQQAAAKPWSIHLWPNR